MQCSVVIPCFNGADLTAACLDSLLAQSEPHDLEILLVDNASTDTTPELDRRHPCVRVLRQPTNRGFAGGVNAGIRAARHPFVLVLNNDTLAAPNLLSELHRALESDPRIGATAPVSNHVKGPARLPIGHLGRDHEQRILLAAELGARSGGTLQDVDTLAGLCLLIRRTTFDQVGWFDERFGHGNFEDDDFCLRLRLLGHRLVIVRTAFLHHEGHATFRAMGIEMREEILRRRAQFVAKWQHDPAGRAVIAAMLGNHAGAAEAAHAARTIWPQWADAHWHMARGLADAGDPRSAALHLCTLLRECPHHSEAALELGLHLLASGQRVEAQRQLAWTLDHCHLTEQNQIHMLRRLGEIAHDQGSFKEAAQNFRAALELARNDGELHNWLGSTLLEQASRDDGNLPEAVACFDRAIELGFALAFTNRGIAHHRLGRTAAALRDFREAVARLPNDRIAKSNLAALERQLGLIQYPELARPAATEPCAPSAAAVSSVTIDSIEALGTQPIA